MRAARLLPPLLSLCFWILWACTPHGPRPRPEPGGSLRYLALGDSFTIGTGAGPAASFPARLASRLRAAGRPVALRNLAVNGYTTQDLIDEELPALGRPAPDLITVAIGANDIVRGSEEAAYRGQVRRIFAALREGGARQVLVLPQPDWSRSPAAAWFGARGQIRAQIERFNAVLREEAQASGYRYVDLDELMRRQAQDGMLAPDGLHPSAQAHDEWAAALLPQVR